MVRSKIKALAILFFSGYLLASCFAFTAKSEDITTGNLLPNVGDGVDWGSSSTEQINPGGSGYVSNNTTFNGFTITCPTSQSIPVDLVMFLTILLLMGLLSLALLLKLTVDINTA